MKFALINPNWSFDGSIYFGCREPHLPLEYGYSKALIERAGHEAEIIDGQLFGLSLDQIRSAVADYRPDFTVVTTAPSYLFWRCAPPELRVPQQVIEAVRGIGGALVAVGPHGSTTPRAAYAKLGVDVLVMGECEDMLYRLASEPWDAIPSLCTGPHDDPRVNGGPYASRFTDLPALSWPKEWIGLHHHHHHRFDTQPCGPGAEMETSRGCPYRCSFCTTWERALDHYLTHHVDFSDIQDQRPCPLHELELATLGQR